MQHVAIFFSPDVTGITETDSWKLTLLKLVLRCCTKKISCATKIGAAVTMTGEKHSWASRLYAHRPVTGFHTQNNWLSQASFRLPRLLQTEEILQSDRCKERKEKTISLRLREAVFRIRILSFGPPRCESVNQRSRSSHHQATPVRKPLISICFVTFYLWRMM